MQSLMPLWAQSPRKFMRAVNSNRPIMLQWNYLYLFHGRRILIKPTSTWPMHRSGEDYIWDCSHQARKEAQSKIVVDDTTARSQRQEEDLNLGREDWSGLSDEDNNEQDDSDFNPNNENLQSTTRVPRTRRRRARLQRARTAREWHQHRNAKMTPAQIQDPTWKQEQLDKLHDRSKAGTRKRKAPQSTNEPVSKRFDPRVFLGRDGSRSPRSSGGAEGPQNSAKTKKDWWKTFKEQNHGIDLHKCVKDKNTLLRQSSSFGFKRMRPSGDSRWELDAMPTSELNTRSLLQLLSCWTVYRSSPSPADWCCVHDQARMFSSRPLGFDYGRWDGWSTPLNLFRQVF